mgnify:CR=1 FL=1
MIGIGIHDGDRVVIRRQGSAEYGQAVVALIGDEATIKTFRPEKGRIILHPENPRLKDIIVATGGVQSAWACCGLRTQICCMKNTKAEKG